jgi:hypothetical protein
MPTREEVAKQPLEQRMGRMSRAAEDLDSRDSLRQWPERRRQSKCHTGSDRSFRIIWHSIRWRKERTTIGAKGGQRSLGGRGADLTRRLLTT